jgi:TonB family protein
MKPLSISRSKWSAGASSKPRNKSTPLRGLRSALADGFICIAILPVISLLGAQVPTQPSSPHGGGGIVLVSRDTPDFTTKADQLIQAKRWAEAKSVLADGLRQMPPNWTPIEIHDEAKATGRVSVHSWNSDEYLAFVNKHPTYGRGKSSSVWKRPSYSRAYYLVAYIEEELGNLTEAAEALDRGLKFEPDHPMLLAEKAFLCEKQKQFDEALNLYRQAANARPWASNAQIAHALRGQGYRLIELRQFDAAEAAYRQSLELQPGNLTAINELGYIRTHRESVPTPISPSGNPGGSVAAQRIRVAGNVQVANLVSKVAPAYPPLARLLRVQGVVNFKAIIGKDGTIVNLAIISGPSALQDAAAEAVRQWVYRPTLLNGQSVEVATTIAVEFKVDEHLSPGSSGGPASGVSQIGLGGGERVSLRDPGSATADLTARSGPEKLSPWYPNVVIVSPRDPLTVRLLREQKDLSFIPGPKTVGSQNYSRILDAFTDRGWEGFEEEFAALYPAEGPERDRLKGDLLREPVFESEKRLLDWYEAARAQYVKALPNETASSGAISTRVIRADGLYQTAGLLARKYLRFFPDGRVLTLSVPLARPAAPGGRAIWSPMHAGSQVLIASQMREGQDNVYSGKFTIEGARVRFSIASKQGFVDYEGEIRGDAIELHWSNREDGGNRTMRFKFVFVPLVDLFRLNDR